MNRARAINPNGRNAETQANLGCEEKLWKAADTLPPELLSRELRTLLAEGRKRGDWTT